MFHGELVRLRDPSEFAQYLKSLANTPWVVFAKRPFAGPSQILEYLGRYTHRVAIANGRLLDCHDGRVSFRWKDYRAQNKSKAMTLDANEFMRRFLTHVLPKGFRRIRHFGFLANGLDLLGVLPELRDFHLVFNAPWLRRAVWPVEAHPLLAGQRQTLVDHVGQCRAALGGPNERGWRRAGIIRMLRGIVGRVHGPRGFSTAGDAG